MSKIYHMHISDYFLCCIKCLPISLNHAVLNYSFDRLGEACSHVGAMLFKIETFVRYGYTKPDAPTDIECPWKQHYFRKKVNILNFLVISI